MIKNGLSWSTRKGFWGCLDGAARIRVSLLLSLQEIGQLLWVQSSKMFAIVSHLLEGSDSVDLGKVQSLSSVCMACESTLRRVGNTVRKVVLI